jgi:hypothetical protein
MNARATRRNRARRLRRAAERASTEWPEFAPQVDLGSGALGEAQAADREIGRLYALRARKLAEFAAARPASADRAQGEPGAMSAERWALRPEILKPTSEWAAAEASIAFARTQAWAGGQLEEALTLGQRLPGTLAALEGGLLTPDHRRALVEHVAPIADPRLRAEIEAEVLRWVAARAAKGTITTPPQLADAVLRAVTRRDARNRAQEAIKALRQRGVFRQSERAEGLTGLGVSGTVPEIEALHAALSAHVDALHKDPADTRSREQKLLDVLLDLVLRPGENGLPPVQVVLTLVAAVQTALGGDQPAELNGQVVSAETARQLLNALTGAGLGEGVLAELRRIADGDPADPDTAEPDAVDLKDAAGEPSAALAPGDDRFVDEPGWDPWEPDMVAAHEERAADFQRRLAAGAYEDPDPMPDEMWRASVEARLAGEQFEVELDRELAQAQQRWWREYEAGVHPDPDPEADRVDPPPGNSWWPQADRAVEDAGRAVRDARAAVARAERLVRTAARADAADEQTWRRSAAGRVEAARDSLEALAAAHEADRRALRDLLERTSGGGLAERPRIALVDAISGALVSLTDLPGLTRAVRDGADLGAPPPTNGYRPGAELDRFIRHRDRRCRFPGCRRRVCRGEIDHRVAWPEGPTDVTNLAGFCTGDHRGKHQAPGFTYTGQPDGTLVVTTPSGITATTEPPPFSYGDCPF